MTTPQTNPILLHLHRLAARLEELPDRELLRRYAHQHDEEAFARLMRRHRPLVQGVALRLLGNWHDSEDVVQATFLVLARKAGSLRWRDSIACWLYGVAHHLALKAKAAADRRRSKERQAAVPAAADGFDDIRLSEVRTLLDAELAALPQRYRAPILLCCLEAATQEEAARQLGCSLATLKRRLAKGRELLRIRLARRGLTLSAALMAALLVPEPGAAAVITLSKPSATASALAEGALRAMTAAKLKLAAALVLVISLLATGTGWVMHFGARSVSEGSPILADASGSDTNVLVRKDCYGDDLPPGALARLGTLRFREGGWIQDFDLSPDGRGLLTTGWNNIGVHLWDVATGKERYPFPEEKRWTTGYAVAFSPDGQRFATGGYFGFSMWQTSTGKRLYAVTDWGSVHSLAFAPDGRTLATGTAMGWIGPALWETASGKKIAQLKVQEAASVVPHGRHSLAFAPDGRLLASTYGNSILLWDVAKRKEVRRLQGHEKDVQTTVFSPDGKRLASAGEDKTIRLWDIATGREVRPFKGHEAPVTSLVFSPDGKTLISGCGFGQQTIRLWDVASGEQRGAIDEHRAGTSSLVLSKDGKLLLASDGGVVRWWDLTTRREVRRQGGHRSGISGIAFAPDGKRLATASGDGTVRLWDAASGQELHRFDASAAVSAVAFSTDGRLLAGGGHGDIHLWDVSRRRNIWHVRSEEDKGKWGVYYLEFASDGATLATADSFMKGALRDVATGKERLRIAINANRELLDNEGKRIAGKGADAAQLLVPDSAAAAVKRLRAMLLTTHWMIADVAISADGTLLASTGGTCHERTTVWDAATDRVLGDIRGGGASVAISPDGRALAIGGYNGRHGTVQLWEIATMKKRAQFAGHRGSVAKLAFSPDSRILASGGTDTTALVWDLHFLGRSPRPFNGEKCWQALADDDAAQAYQAVSDLVAHPQQAVLLLRQRLPAVRPPEAQLMARLLADLDSERFEVRDKAMQQIEKIGECAKPALHKALDGKPSLEVRLRVKLLLSHIEPAQSSPRQLRELRAVEALEHIGTPESRRLLETLASGAASARLTREAKASLARQRDLSFRAKR